MTAPSTRPSFHIATQRAVSRRQFLRGAGIVMSLPFLDSMLPAFAKAATGGAPTGPHAKPRRMLGICNNLGLLTDQFFPKNAGRDYTLSPYLQSLAAHRNDFSVFSGVSHPNVDGGHPADICFLTAAPHPGSGSFRNTISLDQHIAEQIGVHTRFPSLTLGVNTRSRSLSWTGTGVAIPPDAPTEITYEDGIYVGYRYFDSFGVQPAYEFGYGLSYTQFEYKNLKINANQFSKKLTATIEIMNTGKTAGKEVVQVYLAAPSSKLDKPAQELRAFAKTKLLQPGEKQTITFTLEPSDLASFDPKASAWVAESGNYTLKIGASSRDIRQTTLFSLAKDLTVEKVNRVLVPATKLTELKKKA